MKKVLMIFTIVSIVIVPEIKAQGISMAILAGNGFEDGYNLAFGGRAGAEIVVEGRSLYFGGRAVFHQGTGILDSTQVDRDTKVQYFGGEFGYVLFSRSIKILATGIIGSAEISVEVPNADPARKRKLFLSPGLIFSFAVGDFTLALEGRYLNVSDFQALAVYGSVGIGL